jgi:hypothetical protein
MGIRRFPVTADGSRAPPCVIFGGKWQESFPERSVVLAEGRRVGWAASGRNGGCCDASLLAGAP